MGRYTEVKHANRLEVRVSDSSVTTNKQNSQMSSTTVTLSALGTVVFAASFAWMTDRGAIKLV
jgi:hypothetical protein